jgi:hypothetical protein
MGELGRRDAAQHGPEARATLLFFTKRTQFLPKTILPQLAANMDVPEIVLRKSVGFLYTKRTQFLEGGKQESGNIQCPTSNWNTQARCLCHYGTRRQDACATISRSGLWQTKMVFGCTQKNYPAAGAKACGSEPGKEK